MVDDRHRDPGKGEARSTVERLRSTLDEFSEAVADDPPGRETASVSPLSTRGGARSGRRLVSLAAAGVVFVAGAVIVTQVRNGGSETETWSTTPSTAATAPADEHPTVELLVAPAPSGTQANTWALTAGVLGVSDGCVVIESDDVVVHLPIWPHGSTWDDDGYLVLPDNERVAIGEFVYLGGGYSGPPTEFQGEWRDLVERIEQCLPNYDEEPWIVNSVEFDIEPTDPSDDSDTAPAPAPTTEVAPTASVTLPSERADLREPTDAELRVTDALAELGLEAHRGEHPNPIGVGSADMYIPLPDGSELFAFAHSEDAYSGDSEIISDREVSGVTVHEVQYINGPTADSFVCDEIRYEIRGALPPAYDDIDDFLAAYIEALDCA